MTTSLSIDSTPASLLSPSPHYFPTSSSDTIAPFPPKNSSTQPQDATLTSPSHNAPFSQPTDPSKDSSSVNSNKRGESHSTTQSQQQSSNLNFNNSIMLSYPSYPLLPYVSASST